MVSTTLTANIPRAALLILQRLTAARYEAYIVGGSVRDLLLQRPSPDWDFTTNATPAEIQEIFPDSFYENEFGTVGVTLGQLCPLPKSLVANQTTSNSENQPKTVYEITTFRSESSYQDFRRPSQVTWGKTLREDVARRDFTINALALSYLSVESQLAAPDNLDSADRWYEWWQEAVPVTLTLHDYYQGQDDLQAHVLKAVGEPNVRFQEDALRMLRAVRLASQLNFSIDTATLIAIQQNSSLIKHISWERIRDELLKIIMTNQVADSMQLMATTGILTHVLPELLATRGVDQRGHHEHDVWTHSIRACQMCPSRDPIVKLAALLHDIAKPQTQTPLPGNANEYSFHNHEVIGARIARDIARRLHLENSAIQRIFMLVRWHMFHYQPDMTDAAIRRFIRRVGVENITDMLDLRTGDRLGSGSKRTSWRLEEMKERIEAQLHQPLHIHQLAISGHEVMTAMNMKPGREVGQILRVLFGEVLDDPQRNTPEYLLARLHDIKESGEIPEPQWDETEEDE